MRTTLPGLLKAGDVVEYGVSKIVFDKQGRLEACDPYGCVDLRVPIASKIYIEPIPAITRPQQLTECIYVDFAEPIAFDGGETSLWFLAPFELAVAYKERTVVSISPTKVKYTLVGDLVNGIVCRYHKSIAGFSRNDILGCVEPGLGLVRAIVKGKAATIPGIGFYVSGLPLYVDEEGFIYYPLVEVEVVEGAIQNRTTTNPPLEGLKVTLKGKRFILPPSLTQPL